MQTIIRSCNRIDYAAKEAFETGKLSASHIDKLKQTVTDYFQKHLPTASHRMLAHSHAIAVEEITTDPDKLTRRRVLSRWHAMVMAERHSQYSQVHGDE